MVPRTVARRVLTFLKNPLARYHLQMPPDGMEHDLPDIVPELRALGIPFAADTTARQLTIGESITVRMYTADMFHPDDAEQFKEFDREFQLIIDIFRTPELEENVRRGTENLRNTLLVQHTDLAYALYQYCLDQELQRPAGDKRQALPYCLAQFEAKLRSTHKNNLP